MGKFEKLLAHLTGGRPMRCLGFAFRDCVSGEGVYDFQDKFGRIWMANNRWSWFRCQMTLATEKRTRKQYGLATIKE